MNLRHPSLPRLTARFGRITYRAAVLALALPFYVACSEDEDPVAPPEPIDITLNETSITLVRSRGQTKQLTAEVHNTTNSSVTWTVHNSSIATVSPTGLVTPVADGQTFVTARSQEDPTVNRSVVVNVVSTIVTTSPATAFSWVGGPTRQLAVTVENNDNTNVTWHSTNTSVVTVSSTGLVTPVAAGTAEVYAQSVAQTEKRGTTAFTVDPAPHSFATQLADGETRTHSGPAGTNWYYYVSIPEGATNLTVSIAGGNTQDADIYLYSPVATSSQVQNLSSTNKICSPFTGGSDETCTQANPQTRNYYVVVNAYSSISNVTLKIDVSP